MKFLTSTLALLLAAGAVLAQAGKEKPLPKDLPPYGPEQPYRAPEVRVSALENGLTVWLVAQPGLPKVSFAVAVQGGLGADPKEQPGLAELLANTLTQGTHTRSARQVAEEMQGAGGDLSTRVTRDALILSAGVLSSRAAEGLSVLADVVQNAAFSESEVDLAKSNLSDSLRQREASPEFLAGRALARAMFGEHPYGVLAPTQESIKSATPELLRQEFVRRFRPDRALFVAVGDFEPAQMEALVRARLGAWHAPAGAPLASVPIPSSVPPHAIFYVARPGSVQTVLTLGALGPLRGDADMAAAEVANTIYGGAFGSRLVANIREDKGYTYSPAAFLQIFHSAGVARTQAEVRNEVTGPSLNEIFYELNRLATTSPSDDELAKAKRYLTGLRAIEYQARSAVAAELASLWVAGLPPGEIGEHGKKIQAVTPEQVDAAARKYFPAAHMTIVAVGDEKVIRESLAPFGLPLRPAP